MVWSLYHIFLNFFISVLEVNKINAFAEFLGGKGTFGTQDTYSMLDIKQSYRKAFVLFELDEFVTRKCKKQYRRQISILTLFSPMMAREEFE